ncbi:aromatic ring-hydroxylating oxygenase subunit alpha [Acaryochloris marina]|uniref:aromatic ring-hydroxylating oxygenase subunit alpha n=1 Tax=Acaryochloris marina TaxID=155978 RepID=UPI0021C2AF29|nr:aromatic ring-hydroxylating dioxygenase subunit alpha [Acaryochloris marina]BDM83937.1 (2Fe-2S)-binding protein [Acaryochloris marina MBIC10699]
MDEKISEYLKSQVNFEFQRFAHKQLPPKNFQPLPDIPADRYISNDFFVQEQTHIWSKTWLLAGHQDELPNIGSYLLWENTGIPILIVRGSDKIIRAFYNTCRHRGGPLVRDPCGTQNAFVCKYHCWAYDLDGQLKYIPDEHEFVSIDKSQRGLIPIRCELFGNWIFINQDPDAISLEEFLGVIVGELQDFEPDDLHFVHRYHIDMPVNWKIMIDAFQEVYHLKHIHPETVDKLLDHRGTAISLFPNGHSRMMVPANTGADHFVPVPPTEPLEEDTCHEVARSGSLSYNIFPNIITPISPVTFPFLLFWPIARDRTIFEVIYFTRGINTDKNCPEWQQRITNFNMILGEDNENLPWIQRSIESGVLEGIPLSYQERRIYHFHEYVDKTVGVHNIPTSLRVIPRLKELEVDGKGQPIQ